MNTRPVSYFYGLLFGLATIHTAGAAADLILVGVPTVSPVPYLAGQPLKVTYTFKNNGDAAAPACSTRVQIFTPFSTQYTTAEFPVPALAKGAQSTQTHTVTVNDKAWTGTWEARVRLDTNFEVPGDPTVNNVATPVPFRLLATKPDLKFNNEESPGPCPLDNVYGGKMQMAFIVHNDSTVEAPASKIRVQVYDRMHNTVAQDFFDMPAIPADGKRPFVYSYQLPPSGTEGSWSVFVVLNDGGIPIPETGAFNNSSQEIGFRVRAPGSAAGVCSFPSQLMNPQFQGNNMILDLYANAGSTVNIQSSTDLKTWTPAGSHVMVNGVNRFTTPLNGPRRFFRVQ